MTRRKDAASRAAVESAKQDNLGQLLLEAARRYDTEARRRIGAKGRGELRAAHARLFPHIDWEGTRITDLAARVGTTKQAVGQTVSELEAEGLVRRKPDPADGRARLVAFTAKGRRAMVDGLAVLAHLEADLGQRLSERQIDALKRGLDAVIDTFVDRDAPTDQRR